MLHLLLLPCLLGLAAAYPGPYPAGGSCNFHGPQRICIAAPAASNAVLQRAPAAAAITGSVPNGYGIPDGMTVRVNLTGYASHQEGDQGGAAGGARGGESSSGFFHSVTAKIRPDRTCKVLLPPRPTFGNYSVSAECSGGCSGVNASTVVSLVNITFGDVYVCSGQSNMQLMMDYTFSRNASISKIRAGKYSNIRLFYGPMNFDYATNRTDIWVIHADQAGDPVGNRNELSTGGWRYPSNLVTDIPGGHDAPPWYLATEFGRMYATCWYTFEALTDSIIAAGQTPPPFGLVAVAVGGTKIAQWVEWDAQGECRNVTCCDTADCTQSPTSNPAPYQPITHTNCSGNAQLYNGLIAPLVNTTIKGWLWYQGENSLCYDAGSYLQGTGYGCMMAKLVASWRKVWSAVPGTTDPTAPFGIVSLADGTDEGFGINMRQFRWSQTANYGVLPNPAMPNTFLADAFDLGDPWHSPICALSGTFNGGPYSGTSCCLDASHANGAQCVGDHRGKWSLNDTRDWANLGTLHPRLKRPVGERLSRGLFSLAYGGTSIATGPTLAGCSFTKEGGAGGVGGEGSKGSKTGGKGGTTTKTGGSTLTLIFNASLLRGETVSFDATHTIGREDTALYVLVNASVDVMGEAFVNRIVANHHPAGNPDGTFPYYGPFADGNEMGVRGWVPVAATAGPTKNTLVVDLSHLPEGATVSAIRYGAGSGGYNATTGEYLDRGLGKSLVCCGPHVDIALQPCAPESCPIKASGQGALPASPFFAAVDGETGKCRCFAPQTCSA